MDRINESRTQRSSKTRRRPTTVTANSDAVAARFLRSARLCRTRDLEQLAILVELVRELSELIHSLQKERGASSIFLGSSGAQFSQRLKQRQTQCRALELAVRERLEHIDEKLDRMSSGARFYTRVALALRALDTLESLRREISTLVLAPQDSVRAFTEVIGPLLAVGFEVGDIAADPDVSGALVALVNFAQAKEYAGQERATVGAALSLGAFDSGQLHQVHKLIQAQEQSFRIFSEFAHIRHTEAFDDALAERDFVAVSQMRDSINRLKHGESADFEADAWYQHTTRRIDSLHVVEDAMSRELSELCQCKLTEARRAADDSAARTDEMPVTVTVGMLLTTADPATGHSGPAGGVGLYTLENAGPQPVRSILSVLQAQSQRIDDVSAQLESARAALGERKVVDRAKALLMGSRNLSEQDAYTLMRDTAMRQNKRIADIAESIISMADILKG